MNWTLIATILTAANGVVAGLMPAGPWGPVVVAAVGLLATIAAKMAPGGTQLTPSPTTNDDSGPKVGKASGEAGQAAGKGPFKP